MVLFYSDKENSHHLLATNLQHFIIKDLLPVNFSPFLEPYPAYCIDFSFLGRW